MKTFWDASAREEFCRRVDRLTPTASAQWGKFNPTEMLAHLNDAMRMALGELPVKSKNLPLRYPPLKQLIVYALPFPKGAPTAPELVARCSAAEFIEEQAAFRAIAERLAAKSPREAWPEHPAFGRLTHQAWGVLSFRHTDHHLRQFGV
jgi:Protein of unknown function (DUF1569)